MTKLEEFIEDCKDEVIRKGVLEFYFGIRNFIYIHDRLDENYLIYSELSEEGKCQSGGMPAGIYGKRK